MTVKPNELASVEGLDMTKTTDLEKVQDLILRVAELRQNIAALDEVIAVAAQEETALRTEYAKMLATFEDDLKRLVSDLVSSPEIGGSITYGGMRVSAGKSTTTYDVDERILRADPDLLERMAAVEVQGHSLLAYTLRPDVLNTAIQTQQLNLDDLVRAGVLVPSTRKAAVRVSEAKATSTKQSKGIKGK